MRVLTRERALAVVSATAHHHYGALGAHSRAALTRPRCAKGCRSPLVGYGSLVEVVGEGRGLALLGVWHRCAPAQHQVPAGPGILQLADVQRFAGIHRGEGHHGQSDAGRDQRDQGVQVSAASLRRCSASTSFFRSTPDSFLYSVTM